MVECGVGEGSLETLPFLSARKTLTNLPGGSRSQAMTPINFPTSTSATSAIRRRGDDSNTRRIEPKPFARGSDRVELSDAARAAASDSTPIRQDLVNRVREQIAAGRYESPDKVAIAHAVHEIL